MSEIEIKVKGFKCERCGHEWIPRVTLDELKGKKKIFMPTTCPKCKSPYWNKPKRNKNES